MTLPLIVATGNIVNNPELIFTSGEVAMLKFRMACNERKRAEDGIWADGRAAFLSVTVWRQAAEQAAAELNKGHEVTVQGRLVIDEYTDKDGNTRQGVSIDSETIARTYGRRKNDHSPAPRPSQVILEDEEPF